MSLKNNYLLRRVAVFREENFNSVLYEFLSIALFVNLIILGAKIKIYTPYTPVPFTLQTFFVIYSGLHLKRFEFMPALIYVSLGIFGFPVFAGNGPGIEYIIGPTGGYLLAFTIAPVLTSKIYKNRASFMRSVVASITGCVFILLLGSIYLGLIYGSIYFGFCAGFLPFLPAEIAKALGAGFCKNINNKIFRELRGSYP